MAKLPFTIRSESDYKGDKFWEEQESDYGEMCIPDSEGLITEMVYAMRGTELPTIWSIWGGVVTINAMLKREAWIKWSPHNLYPNLFCCIVGNAGDKKSAALDVWYEILKRAVNVCKDSDPYLAYAKDLRIIKDRITPEALLKALEPVSTGVSPIVEVKDKKGRPLLVGGEPVTYELTSEALVYVSELSTLFSKAQYSQTMSEIFLDIYDCHEEWFNTTKGGGQIKLRKLCTSLIGATTTSALKMSLPENMLGDGFLSRTTMVYLPANRKCFPMPMPVPGAPTLDELGLKMAWIAGQCVGEHTLSSEAYEVYVKWYNTYKVGLREDPEMAGIRSRFDKVILKVALAFKAQRYGEGNEIQKEDIEGAIRLVETTYQHIPALVNSINRKEFYQEYQKVSNMIKEADYLPRMTLMTRAKVPMELLDKILEQLRQEGSIIVHFEGNTVPRILKRKKEIYMWTGATDGKKRMASLEGEA